MALLNQISDYTDGATGTILDADGTSVGYTISSFSGIRQDFPGIHTGFNDNFGVFDGPGFSGDGIVTATFDSPVRGVVVEVTASDSLGSNVFYRDGVQVNLQTLLDAGEIAFTQNGSNYFIDGSGRLAASNSNTDVSNTRNIATIEFLTPITSIGVDHVQTTAAPAGDAFRFGTSNTSNIVCFTRGTMIKTSQGDKVIEDLSVGDFVATMDEGFQPIRWIGSTKRDAIDMTANPKLRPIRISTGALGNDSKGNALPREDLIVSRQHRILLSSAISEKMFGEREVLIPAIKLTEFDGIDIVEDIEEVEYFHLLFDKHEIIWANGAPTESLFTGREALKAVSSEARAEIIELFPEINDVDFMPIAARHILNTGKKMKHLIARHKKNRKPVYSV